jgi:uncharacterized repeat protein (TIGR03803 family)
LVLSGKTLYGTANDGGTNGRGGTVFAINSDGTGYRILHSFNGDDGYFPDAELILSSNMLYGTTYQGGSFGNGVVFAVSTNGSNFIKLYSFTATPYSNAYPGSPNYTNSDGTNPQSRLLHNHFQVHEGEVLVEDCDDVTRTLTIRPMKRTDIKEENLMQTNWRLDTKTPVLGCRGYCVMREGSHSGGGHHFVPNRGMSK